MERDLIIHYFSVETIHEIFKAADYQQKIVR